MPTDILMNDDHDIDYSYGGSLHTKTDEALAQRIKIALLLRKGEWLPNLAKGVPYQQTFFNVKNNKGFIDTFLQGYILDIEGVESILSYTSSINLERHLEVSFKVKDSASTIVNVTLEV